MLPFPFPFVFFTRSFRSKPRPMPSSSHHPNVPPSSLLICATNYPCRNYQKINHFPASSEISRKDSLARNLAKMQPYFPSEFNFFPKSWILPAEYGKFFEFGPAGPAAALCSRALLGSALVAAQRVAVLAMHHDTCSLRQHCWAVLSSQRSVLLSSLCVMTPAPSVSNHADMLTCAHYFMARHVI